MAAVRAAIADRDRVRCAFVSEGGRRCTETAYLEFDHVEPYATGGGRTVRTMRLLCRRHNQYESELIFGPFHGRKVPTVRERGVPYGPG